ncbi:MAG: hypothetical protein H6714_08560 [Myxococcales bacterium]|nr:hypothetical protein [Myxococcales bacterium]
MARRCYTVCRAHRPYSNPWIVLIGPSCNAHTPLGDQWHAQGAPASVEARLREGAKLHVLDGERGAIVRDPQGAVIQPIPWDSAQSPYIRILLQIVDRTGQGWAMVGWNPPSFVEMADIEEVRKVSETEYVDFPAHDCPTFTIDRTSGRLLRQGTTVNKEATVPISVAGIDEFLIYPDAHPYVPMLDGLDNGVFVAAKCIDFGVDLEARLNLSTNSRYVVREPMSQDKLRTMLSDMTQRSREFGRCDYIAGMVSEEEIGITTLADGTVVAT